jgi:Protein of unknown function (DUF4089)
MSLIEEERMEQRELDVGKYVDLMALLLDLQLPDEYRDGVVANFERIKDIAQVVNEFSLPDKIEAAQIFEP